MSSIIGLARTLDLDVVAEGSRRPRSSPPCATRAARSARATCSRGRDRPPKLPPSSARWWHERAGLPAERRGARDTRCRGACRPLLRHLPRRLAAETVPGVDRPRAEIRRRTLRGPCLPNSRRCRVACHVRPPAASCSTGRNQGRRAGMVPCLRWRVVRSRRGGPAAEALPAAPCCQATAQGPMPATGSIRPISSAGFSTCSAGALLAVTAEFFQHQLHFRRIEQHWFRPPGAPARTARRALPARRRDRRPAEAATEDQQAVVGEQAGIAAAHGLERIVGKLLRAEAGVIGAAHRVAAEAGDHVVEGRNLAPQAGQAVAQGECACSTAPASGRAR